MNMLSSIETTLPRAHFEAAQDAAATWRGRCLDVFARSEAAVTETLLVLATDAARGSSVKLPHLVGQRYDALLIAIGADGPFADECKASTQAVAAFRKHDELRTQISHGVFTVTLDHRGQWYLVTRVLVLRSGRASQNLFVTEQAEAAAILDLLERDGSHLRSALGEVRHHFRKT